MITEFDLTIPTDERNVYRKLREDNGYSLRKLSDEMKRRYPDNWIAAPHISELETGKRDASLRELLVYSKFFNLSVDYLVGQCSIQEDIVTIMLGFLNNLKETNELELIELFKYLLKSDAGYALLFYLDKALKENPDEIDFNRLIDSIRRNRKITFNEIANVIKK